MSNGIDILENIDGQSSESKFEPKLESRQFWGKVFSAFCIFATGLGLIVLAFLIYKVFSDGSSRLNGDLLQLYPSRRPEESGYKAAILGSIAMLTYVLVLVVPLGVCSAIYLEEYAKKNWLSDLIELNIYNLAGIPSIIYGLLGLGLFVRGLYSGRAVLVTGILTITLLILPPVIVISREAIRAVPQSVRQASYGVGATKWQTIRHHVLPSALPGILTAVIISTSRGIGETAPIVVLGAGTVLFDPKASPINFGALFSGNIGDVFTDTLWSNDNFFSVLPYQIYEWVGDPKAEFQTLASAGIIVLLALVLGMNLVAIFLRSRAK
ncbi:MAG: phosphate ABC transporter permease PstA [Pseudanabaena sp.]|jgi:phosphate transport system permease protein|nr:phosphate ABC transporter permease PstA [Pseudanabaena sp. M090S1SP2A07QC]MCA6504941.1 phosphate ABC transporter permease PstA [Pseudanabaena sp. M172S2SP2A07QC]MCA6522180.1 phosphate ABC transporter permease PstA [Pseudanabaena sp. M051S1SP2A07QC]MCA6524774.1 phosphate ABC transporter permease PstA [Pseudanabaena sp. M179S2SP2A07QC]MCA6528949.1 phosphate ABC transporter permease PstA [Pseudanabaena sp. M125S2SP2A07QC]MCA6534781.1 phosphate ABC transporter permease PstA [Pseudanabaena sp. M